ncbi:phenoloxidase-activating factor 2-like isoform X1 [Anopheles darlingi]|uniref:phenoloxidase-activating factor 2-like isoform X1 n=1 Tax=Anopheles darlingi TaxID=43151 RepID=UPI0021005FB7|nr:phenoloxidase-activating factor 2-like isoform X1 [Anopheles darlingi]XP_049535765.1 phenoloxidase-activating factor 2-like isoform X1 [Anopheles darlingi]
MARLSAKPLLLLCYFGFFNGIVVTIKTVEQSLPAPRAFNFPQEEGSPANDLTRQATFNVSNGITSGVLTGVVPIPTGGLVPNIVNPGTVVGGQTCICVPTGRCNASSIGTGTSTDGAGQLDVRIVSNPSANTGVTLTTATTTTTTTPASQVLSVNIVSPSTCQSGLERCCLAGSYPCGLQYPPVANAPAVAANQASYGEYPWQVVLLGPGDVYVGSGALINANHVLTAAHKISDYTSGTRALKVRLGEWDAASTTEPFPVQEFTVTRYFVHPSFSSANLRNDIALLRLSGTVTLGTVPTITTACLPVTSFDGSRCWVSGWGKNDFVSGAFQSIPKEVDVPVVATASCQTALRTTRLGPNFVLDPTSFLCAGGELGKDACTGDGGSPLVCALNGRFYVVGLVAWGIGCGANGIPGVYVNVASYISWITNTIATV